MNTQSGRSMVEMLGVLAIVGVLSVGAIAGYSKAMTKYKLNKHAEQINTVINVVSRNEHSFDTMQTAGLTATFIKMGEIPQEMIKSGDYEYIYDIFGQGWAIYISGANSRTIYFSSYASNGASSLSTKSADNLAICQNMILAAKENRANISGIATRSGHFSADDAVNVLHGDCECRNDNRCLKDITLDDIYTLCSNHIANGRNAEFFFYWRNCNLDDLPI